MQWNWLRKNGYIVIGPVTIGSAIAYKDGCFDQILAMTCYFISLAFLAVLSFGGRYRQLTKKDNGFEMKTQTMGIASNGGQKDLYMVKLCLLMAFILCGTLFVFLVSAGGKVVLVGGCLFAVTVILWSWGPYPLSNKGYGEIATGISFGLVGVCGTYYIQTDSLQNIVFVAAIPAGLLATSMAVIKNLESFDLDKQAGKRTLVGRLGRYKAIVCYQTLILASYIVPVALAAMKEAGAFILLPLCTMPMARSLILKAACDLESNLRILHESTGRLILVFSLMFGFGFIYHL